MAAGVLLGAFPVLAASNPQAEAQSPVGWVYRWLNFAIFFGVIAYFLAKKSPPFFRKRQEAIEKAIAESARARQAAESREREIAAKMGTLPSEIARLRERSKQESAGEVERVRALAREEVKRIDQAAQLEILAAERAAQMELKTLAARLAVERAETLLEQGMSPRADAALFGRFLADLAGGAN